MKFLSFSSQFPKKHCREGQPTNFQHLIETGQKTTTIREKCDLKVNEVFKKFVWKSVPYRSEWAYREPLRVVQIVPIEINVEQKTVLLDFKKYLTEPEIAELARRDGLLVEDFWSWFGINKQSFQGFRITFEKV